MEKLFIWNAQKFSYLKRGNGHEVVLCFHGYGLNAQSWNVFSSLDTERFCWYQFDLPFHGKTQVDSGLVLKPEELLHWLKEFKRQEGIESQVHLLSFSLGGNFALALSQFAPNQLASVCLIAADGLAPKPGFHWLTLNPWGHRLFRRFIRRPRLVFALIRLAQKVGVIPQRVADFFISSIDTKEKRVLLFKRWCSIAKLRTTRRELVWKLNEYNIPVIMIFSKNDRVIPIKPARNFSKRLKHLRWVERNEGHQLMQKHIAVIYHRALMEILTQNKD